MHKGVSLDEQRVYVESLELLFRTLYLVIDREIETANTLYDPSHPPATSLFPFMDTLAVSPHFRTLFGCTLDAVLVLSRLPPDIAVPQI